MRTRIHSGFINEADARDFYRHMRQAHRDVSNPYFDGGGWVVMEIIH